ncbi:MAG: SDR family NAD(P)-dependent oxidoreductase [Chthoniobacterales bacterium]
MNSFSLKDRHALVTGSTRGIGLAVANAIHEAGASIIQHGRAEPEIKGNHLLKVDLSKTGASLDLIEQAFAHQPDLDLLVCNAGSFYDVPFLEMDEEKFEKTFHLNVQQTYFLIQAFARKLVERKRPGAVVIISSTNGFHAEEDSTAYDCSKGALVMMTRSVAMALAPHDIRVNAVAPGLIYTPLTSWLNTKPDVVEHYEKKILTRKIGEAQDCAGICAFLCSDAAKYIIGQTIVVDGGLTVGQIGRL